MILYALACDDGHRFESWFRSGTDYDEQVARGLVACPVCRSVAVSKTIMAPAIVSRGAVMTVDASPATPSLLDANQGEMRIALKAIRDKVLSEGEDVGTRFPDQARKMHDGDIPHRQIHGQATVEEARALIEDGVAILPLPMLPDALN